MVATPIGNLADITLRALEVLGSVDTVVCEDTRVTRKLMQAHGLDTKLTSYHEHNAARVRPKLIERMKNGESMALVSDAGTPLVSDPGYKLVRAAIDQGLVVTGLPGASSPLTALVVSGLPSERFFFGGFLPPKGAARRRALEELAAVPATLLVLESGRRLAATLGDLTAALGDRPAAVARELTKLFEEVRRDSLSGLAESYSGEGPPKGEIVIVVGPPEKEAVQGEDLDQQILSALESASLRDAAALVAAATGLPKRRVYERALALAERRRSGQ